jgi:hypothetical protein
MMGDEHLASMLQPMMMEARRAAFAPIRTLTGPVPMFGPVPCLCTRSRPSAVAHIACSAVGLHASRAAHCRSVLHIGDG